KLRFAARGENDHVRGADLDGDGVGGAGELDVEDGAGDQAGAGYGAAIGAFGGGAIEEVVGAVDGDFVKGVVRGDFDLAKGDFGDAGKGLGVEGVRAEGAQGVK